MPSFLAHIFVPSHWQLNMKIFRLYISQLCNMQKLSVLQCVTKFAKFCSLNNLPDQL